MSLFALVLFGFFMVAYAIYPFMPFWRSHSLSIGALASLNRQDHEQALEEYRKLLKSAAKMRSKKMRDAYEFVARQGIGSCLCSLSRFGEAEPALRRAVQLLEQGVEQEPIVEISSRFDLARCLSILGKPDDCAQQIEELRGTCAALPTGKLQDSLEHLRCRISGAVLSHQFHLEDQLRELVISFASEAKPPYHDLIVRCELDRATSLTLQFRHADANEVVERALNRYHDLDETTLLSAWNRLSTSATVSGDYKKAVEYGERALDQTRKLGSEFDALLSELTVAGSRMLYGDTRVAIQQGKAAFARLCETHHPDSPTGMGHAMQVMPLLLLAGDFETANELLVRIESKPKDELRYEGVTLSSAMIYRSFFFLELDRPIEALEATEEVFAEFREAYPDRDPISYDFSIALPIALTRVGRLDEAKQALNQVHAARLRNTQLANSPLDRVNMLLIQSELSQTVGNFEESLLHAQEAADTLEANTLPTHHDLPSVWLLMGRSLVDLNRVVDALPCFEKAESARALFQPSDHFAFAGLYEAWSDALEQIGEKTTADELRTDAERIRTRWSGVIEQSVQQWRTRA